MPDMRNDYGTDGLNRGRMAAAAMVVGAALFALVGTMWGILSFHALSQQPAASYRDLVGTGVLLLGTWAGALLLWGGAEYLRRLDDVLDALLALGDLTRPGAQARTRASEAESAAQTRALQQLLGGLNELRDIALLSNEERKLRATAESALLTHQLEQEVPALLREHNWREAQLRVQRARARFPSVPTWDALAEQVEQARAKFETHDITKAAREIDDLAALNAWDRAALVIRELKHRHPKSEQVAELARRVQTGLEKSVAEERARLMAQAQEATNQRRWGDALRLVDAIIEKFPQSAEAHDLRQQVPTLQLNAEIQARQHAEAEIRELVKAKRFAEAAHRARELIDRYPDSPQAAVLREQLPRLESRAARR